MGTTWCFRSRVVSWLKEAQRAKRSTYLTLCIALEIVLEGSVVESGEGFWRSLLDRSRHFVFGNSLSLERKVKLG